MILSLSIYVCVSAYDGSDWKENVAQQHIYFSNDYAFSKWGFVFFFKRLLVVYSSVFVTVFVLRWLVGCNFVLG